jgi:hypothetical protein
MTSDGEVQEEGLLARERRLWSEKHPGYVLRTPFASVMGTQVPACESCGAFVSDLERHGEAHLELVEAIELLRLLHHNTHAYDGEGNVVSIPHKLSELQEKML